MLADRQPSARARARVARQAFGGGFQHAVHGGHPTESLPRIRSLPTLAHAKASGTPMAVPAKPHGAVEMLRFTGDALPPLAASWKPRLALGL